jgi:hypothetical protein
MAPKHEPWYKPRDEDEDDKLLDRLGQRDSRYDRGGRGGNGRNNGGCALLIVAGAGVAATLSAVATAIQHLI